MNREMSSDPLEVQWRCDHCGQLFHRAAEVEQHFAGGKAICLLAASPPIRGIPAPLYQLIKGATHRFSIGTHCFLDSELCDVCVKERAALLDYFQKAYDLGQASEEQLHRVCTRAVRAFGEALKQRLYDDPRAGLTTQMIDEQVRVFDRPHD